MKNIQKLLNKGVKPEEIFEWVAKPFGGFARVELNKKWSFIDENFKLIGDGNQWLDEVYDFEEGFASVILNNKWYKLRNDGVLCDLDTKKPINQETNCSCEFLYNKLTYSHD